jgi:hypothetical protein
MRAFKHELGDNCLSGDKQLIGTNLEMRASGIYLDFVFWNLSFPVYLA